MPENEPAGRGLIGFGARTAAEPVSPARHTRPMRRIVLPTVLACLLLPAAASGSGNSVIHDCTDNDKIDSYHSQSDYKAALGNIPSDVEQYTDCRSLIRAAQRRDASKPPPGSGGGSGGGSGSGTGSGSNFGAGLTAGASAGAGAGATTTVPPTAAQSSALGAAAATAAPVLVGGKPITPGATGLASDVFRHSIPGPLLAVLIALGVAALLSLMTRTSAGGLNAPGGLSKVFDRVFPRRA